MHSFHLVDKSCHRRKEEVQFVRVFFAMNGWEEAAEAGRADCVLLFTCAEMRYKVANAIEEVARLSSQLAPDSELIVGSCLPKTDEEALARVFQGRTITPTDFTALDSLPGITVKVEEIPPIFGADADFRPIAGPDSWNSRFDISYKFSRWTGRAIRRCLPVNAFIPIAAKLAKTRRAVIHVSAGCAKNCSYCAIRFATGPVRSKPLNVVMRAIADGLHRGYRTFDLLSDSIGGYGIDLGTNLGELMDRILALPGGFTIGISDLHPHEFIGYFDKILDLCAASRLHYLYVPVQSGSERILRMMNRACNMNQLTEKFLTVKKYPEVFLQTGIIVGFPGETEPEFNETVDFLQTVRFDNVYVHYYCDMPGAIASGLPEKIDRTVMIKRLEKINSSGIRHNRAQTRIEWESTLEIS